MQRIETALPGVWIIEPKAHGDARGWFMETYSERAFAEMGITARFVQDNQSYTRERHTLRGLHYQKDPMAQAKLVRVTRGAVLDVAVDLRKGSPTYLRWVGVQLSAENRRMLFLPRGFAHGFLTLTEDVEFVYKVDSLYDASLDRGIRFDDPSIGVNWGTKAPILSDKDRAAPLLADADCSFTYVNTD